MISRHESEVGAAFEDEGSTSVGRVPYGSWASRVLAWDTLLPACVATIPAAIGLVFPDRRGVMESTAVILPTVAFLLRLDAGRRHIASNRCSEALRRLQSCLFCVGILPLVLVDCMLILSGVMPKGALFATREELIVLVVLISIYLVSMTVVMYPGRTLPSPAAPHDPAAFPGSR